MAKEGIQLFIHKHDDIDNVYQILPGRRDPKALSEVGGVGGGSFFISRTDPKIQDANVLKSRNLCKVKVDGNVVDAFLINNREPILVSQGENKDRGYLVSGAGLKSWFNDASVAPYGGIKKNSMDQRYFNFASESGSWYVPGDWVNPVIYGTINVDARWGVDRVKKWPEKAKNAKWIWAAPYQSPAPDTPCYFRWSVTTGAGLFAIYVTADDYFELYVDGEQIAKSNVSTSASYEAARVEIPLSAGNHTIAFMSRNILAPGFNGPAALAAAFFSVADDKTETLISQSGSGTWKALAYPAQEPGWTAGEVMNKLLDEAQARGVLFPTYLARTFSNTQDSKGTAWADKLAWTFKVGESYSSVLSKFEDLYDVWINPATMTLNMAPYQGTDRSTGPSPVQFVLGRDIVEAKTKAQGNIKNSLMVKSLEGWTTEEDSASVNIYGRIEDSIDTGASQSMAKKLAALVFSSRAQEEIGATYQVISQKYKPNVDYFQGDWVLAPNERGAMVPRRIVSISYEESSAGRPIPTVEFDTIFQNNEAKLANAVGKLGGGGVGSGLGNVAGSTPGVGGPIILPPTTSPITLTPKAPTGLTASSAGYWSANGVNTLSTVTLNWAAVTQYVDDSALVVDHYEVERKLSTNIDGWEIIGKYYTNQAIIPAFTPDQSWDFRVSAVDDLGAVSQPSTSVTHSPVGPTTPMPAPEAPTLYSDLGIIVVTWNGELTGDVQPPPQFRYVYAEMSTAASGQPWVRVGGSIQRGGGQIQITTEAKGATRWIRLFAIDGVGIVSDASPSASIVVKGIDGADLDQAVTDAINNAQNTANSALTAANGKNKLYFQAAMPPGTNYNIGDTWFDTDDGNKIYSWVSPGTWAAAALGTNAIADAAIVNAKIANLDAGKISTGTLGANRIGAKSIDVTKIAVGDFENFATGSDFENTSLNPWYLPLGWAIVAGTAYQGNNSLRCTGSNTTGTAVLNNTPEVHKGEGVYLELWAYRDANWNGGANSQLTVLDQSNNVLASLTYSLANLPTANTWVKFSTSLVVPSGVTALQVKMANNATAGYVWLDNIIIRRQTTGELIVDGAITTRTLAAEAITAQKIKAGTITVNELSPSVGDELVLSANGAITTLISVQDTQASQIASTQETANDAALAASEASQAAGVAQGQVNTINGTVSTISAAQQATQAQVTSLQTWFRVDAQGAHVGQTGSVFQTHIRPNQFDITENDVVTTYWQAGQMVVPSLVADKMKLTNFQFEAYASGMVIRLL